MVAKICSPRSPASRRANGSRNSASGRSVSLARYTAAQFAVSEMFRMAGSFRLIGSPPRPKPSCHRDGWHRRSSSITGSRRLRPWPRPPSPHSPSERGRRHFIRAPPGTVLALSTKPPIFVLDGRRQGGDVMQNEIRGLTTAIRGSRLLRLLLIGFLVLLVLIPAAMIGGLVSDRRATREGAVEEVTGKWGRMQVITGPALVIPYVQRRVELDKNGQKVVRVQTHRLTVLPETLTVRGDIESEERHRGIFSVPVYRLRLEVSGRFAKPNFSDWNVEGADVRWDRAELGVGISDARAIQEQTDLTWNGRTVPFLPGTSAFDLTNTGIHAPLTAVSPAPAFDFKFPLVLNGSVGVYFVPFGRETAVSLRSNWPDPSFQGNWLPAKRSVTDKGFEASWKIPFLGRNYPQAWTDGASMSDTVAASKFGLDLITPVDEYRMAERSTKYAGLFILLTFAAIWLIEVLGRLRVHSIQYLLVGAAMCVFFFLELALSEHLGFSPAYTVASVAVIALIASYSLAALRSPRRAGVVGGLVALLYGYLYVLLNNQDYALLIGSVGLFLMLAAVMYLTRRIDWHEAGAQGR